MTKHNPTQPSSSLPLGTILHGDCAVHMNALPENSIDLIFADPPYNLQLNKSIYRPNMTKVDSVDDAWDQFSSFEEYDRFSEGWLRAARRVLKDTGTLWVIGTYHNIFRIGVIMQNLGFWILNDVVWVKTNPMPNFFGVRFTNAHETLVWAKKGESAKYTFNHHAMKGLNADKQMRSDWWLMPLTGNGERLKVDGKRAHPTQKPEALLYRVLLASSNPGDVILDPFFGSGTTGVVAKKLHREWIGIEQEEKYITLAQERIAATQPEPYDATVFDLRGPRKKGPRVAFSSLLEHGLLKPGQTLYFKKQRELPAQIKPNGKLEMGEKVGSIHQLGRELIGGAPCNGWDNWYFEQDGAGLQPLETLRQQFREQLTDEVK